MEPMMDKVRSLKSPRGVRRGGRRYQSSDSGSCKTGWRGRLCGGNQCIPCAGCSESDRLPSRREWGGPLIGLPRGVRLEPHRDEPLKHEIQGFPQPKQLWVPLVGCTVRSECLVEPGTGSKRGLLFPRRSLLRRYTPPPREVSRRSGRGHFAQKGPTTCVLLIPDWSYGVSGAKETGARASGGAYCSGRCRRNRR